MTPNHEYFMTGNIMDQPVQSVLKFIRIEVYLHINGANFNVTLPQRPTGSSFIHITLCPAYRLQLSLRVLSRT